MKTFFTFSLKLASLIFLFCVLSSVQLEAQNDPPGPGEGDFRVQNYSTGLQNANFVNRGYVFKPSRDVDVIGMWGGFGSNCTTFVGGIYEVTCAANCNGAIPEWTWGDKVASVTFHGSGVGEPGINLTPEYVDFSEPVTLSSDKFYLIYQGRTEGGTGCHFSTNDLDFENLQIGSAIIDQWYPQANSQYRTGKAPGSFSTTDNVRILVGFRYATDVEEASLADVETKAFQIDGTDNVILEGFLNNSGGATPDDELTLYFEIATNSDFTGSDLLPAEPFTVMGPATNVPFSRTVENLTSGQTYYLELWP